MIRKIVRSPITLVLTSGAVVLVSALLFFFIAGVLVGVFKEIFIFYSRGLDAANSDYQTEDGSLKSEVRKFFTFPYTQESRTLK